LETAIVLGIKFKRGGVMTPCRACTVAKAKQKNLTKVSEHKNVIHQERECSWIWLCLSLPIKAW
jgi:hypothetical protein